jgi:glycerophosphoryl diester phosphodiesterase
MRRILLAFLLLAALPAHAFDLQGHRGARGLAPENTLEGFALALSIGVTTLELDLAMTRDDVLVVSHDRRLNPDHTRGPDGWFLDAQGPAIRSLTLAEVQRYDVGRLKPRSELREHVSGAEGGRWRAHSGAGRSIRPCEADGRRPCTLQHRDEDHANQRRRDAGPGYLRRRARARDP